MNKKILGVTIVMGIICARLTFATTEDMPQPKPGSVEFEKIKSLAGTWKGTSTEDNGKAEPAEINYKVTSMGSAVVETMMPGTPHEMVSIYYDDENGKLSMTHYCALANRPELSLKSADDKTITLELSPTSKLVSEKHMHGLNLSFAGSDQLTQSWTCFEGGKANHTVTINVKKV